MRAERPTLRFLMVAMMASRDVPGAAWADALSPWNQGTWQS
jgi:hypothetical protein